MSGNIGDLKVTDNKDGDFLTLCDALDEYLDEIAGGVENRAEHIPHNTLDTVGEVVVAYSDGQPVGCGSIRHLSPNTAEIKRVFVLSSGRRSGIGRAIMEKLEEIAGEAGTTRLVLETGVQMTDTIDFYRSLGYTMMECYGPYAEIQDALCMEKYIHR